ncbi:unnamed protein product [Heterobilharzia americana]|nr:unnamed protein product [Heterobilharzia americana]
MSQGGFWNVTKVNYSDETKKLLNELVREAKISNSYRHSINAVIRNGESLGCYDLKVPTSCQKTKKTNKSNGPHRPLRPHKRTKSLIELSGAYDPVPYHPPPLTLNTGPSEKLRLAHLMTYGEEPTVNSLKNDEIKDGRLEYLSRRILKYPKVDDDIGRDDRNESENYKNRFEELRDEVEERRQFLVQMESLGRAKEYRASIETEISKLIREMEEIDLKRSKQMYAKDQED